MTLTTQYVWRAGTRYAAADAEKVGQRLSELQEGGKLKPRVVVEDARPADALLHPYFTWDDLRAAELHREEEARRLIRAVHVVAIGGPGESNKTVRALVHIDERVGNDTDSSYVPIAKVMAEPEMYRQVLLRARRELMGWRERYADFEALARVADTAQQVIDFELQSVSTALAASQ